MCRSAFFTPFEHSASAFPLHHGVSCAANGSVTAIYNRYGYVRAMRRALDHNRPLFVPSRTCFSNGAEVGRLTDVDAFLSTVLAAKRRR